MNIFKNRIHLKNIIFCVLLLIIKTNAYVADEECLNYTVYPVQYELTLYPYVFKDGNSFYDCDLLITVIANSPNINLIELDAKDLEIKGDSIKVLEHDMDLVNQYRPYEFDNNRGKLFIYLSMPLKQYSVSRTQYLIRISFSKRVSSHSDGIFTVQNEGSGEDQHLLMTRLSPNKAKYFFPCFDNLQFEAVFKFRVYVNSGRRGIQHTNTTLVIANEQQHSSKDDYRVIEYIPSPQIALYQVGFHHSQFGYLEASSKNNTDILRVWAPVAELQLYTYILNSCVSLLNLIHEYSMIDRALVNGPINIVSVPTVLNGYEIGSWNLLTNSANKLSFQHEYTSVKQMDLMVFELAQQLSRIWLGNPGETERTRWKEEWFKEGVATYLAYHFVTQFNHGLPTEEKLPITYYGLQMKNNAMTTDWHHSTPALENFNRTLAVAIPTRYKDLVAMKTASLLWMVENWIGSEKFHQALIKYINSRRGQYISIADFMAKLDQETVECLNQFLSGSTTISVLGSWFRHPGYPVVDVQVLRDRQPNAVQLKQTQFSYSNHKKIDSNFLIPISYIIQNNQNCFNCYQPRFTISAQAYTFRENLNGGWIILNRNASGYYRVNYDNETWRLIATTLSTDHLSIDELNRAQIVNDVFALFISGDMDGDLARLVLDYLNKELSFMVWDSVSSGFQQLKTEQTGITKTLYLEWQEFIQAKVSTIYKRLMSNVEQWPRSRLFRSVVAELACAVRLRACHNQMRRLHADHRRAGARLDPDLRGACYHAVLQSGDVEDVDVSNRFEQEDKIIAENKVREENRFLFRIPVGTPRPQPILMPSSTPTTTEEIQPTSAQQSRSARPPQPPLAILGALLVLFAITNKLCG